MSALHGGGSLGRNCPNTWGHRTAPTDDDPAGSVMKVDEDGRASPADGGPAESAMNLDSEGHAPPKNEEACSVCESDPGQSFNSMDLSGNQLDEYDTQATQSVLLTLNDSLEDPGNSFPVASIHEAEKGSNSTNDTNDKVTKSKGNGMGKTTNKVNEDIVNKGNLSKVMEINSKNMESNGNLSNEVEMDGNLSKGMDSNDNLRKNTESNRDEKGSNG